MTITLCDCSTAPSPRRARILLVEKGVAQDTVQVDLHYLVLDGEESRTLRPLQAAAITCRIAFGPRAGQKVLTLRG